jgi:hypothetical protein
MVKPVHLAQVDLQRELNRLQEVCKSPYQWPPERKLNESFDYPEADRRAQAASNTTGEFSHELFIRALERVREAGDDLGKAVARKPPGNSWDP